MLAHSVKWVGPQPAAKSWRRRLARRIVPVGRTAVLVLAKGERPHPRHSDRRGSGLHDATNRDAVALWRLGCRRVGSWIVEHAKAGVRPKRGYHPASGAGAAGPNSLMNRLVCTMALPY